MGYFRREEWVRVMQRAISINPWKDSHMWFILVIAHEIMLFYSLFIWRIEISSRIYSLIFKNYDVSALLSNRPFFYIVFVILVFVVLNHFVSRCLRTYSKLRGVFIYMTALLLVGTTASVIIANYPSIIHRDVYLHGRCI